MPNWIPNLRNQIQTESNPKANPIRIESHSKRIESNAINCKCVRIRIRMESLRTNFHQIRIESESTANRSKLNWIPNESARTESNPNLKTESESKSVLLAVWSLKFAVWKKKFTVWSLQSAVWSLQSEIWSMQSEVSPPTGPPYLTLHQLKQFQHTNRMKLNSRLWKLSAKQNRRQRKANPK